MKQLWIPADRFLDVVYHVQDWRVAAGAAGERNIRRLRSGELEFISLRAADGILIRLGLEQYWHIRREDGGLADIYEDGAQYGAPSNEHVGPRPKLFVRKYATHADKLAARREAYKRYRLRIQERQARREAA